ncbi:carboxylesterase family protein-like protein [Acephala macrosclerotiorum]|nr:carboxylesterase family protein-like protein [Acephala macrosclerotiorum]
MMRCLSRLCLLGSFLCRTALAQNASLPTVDLAYEIIQATVYNETAGYYNFSNVRYAAPPLGDLRFKAPKAPATNRSSVQTGTTGVVCPQAIPQWILEAIFFTANYTQGLPFNASAWVDPISVTLLPQDGRTSEDCLFLDVIVPQTVLESNSSSAPVMVWIHGGGYAQGSKSDYGMLGEIANPSNNVVFLAINYRLGAFGFVSGPSLQAQGGDANAGLLDQRFALEWVQANIAKFGGDPSQVTVMGESAGGGSILHQITAYGGAAPLPFQRAVTQSPAYYPFKSNAQQDSYFHGYLSLLNVTTLAQARNLSSSSLIAANIAQSTASEYGEFIFGPCVDGIFVPDYPPRLLLNGEFSKDAEVMTGHNAEEGVLFTPPNITNEITFDAWVSSLFPTMPLAEIDYIETVLYPPPSNGTTSYTNNLDRAILMNSEMLITCNAFYLDTAYDNQTYAYEFAVYPAIHGADLTYTFYDGPFGSAYNGLAFNSTVAEVLQDYELSFTKAGKPTTSVAGVPEFRMYGVEAILMEMSGISKFEIRNSRF